MEKLRKISGIAAGIVKSLENVTLERSPDYNLYMDRQEQINLRLAEELEREGVRFAVPVQSVKLDAPR